MTEYADAVEELFSDPTQSLQRLTRPAQAATQLGVADIDEDPDQAARSIQLSRATNVPAPVIHGDVENFEREHKQTLTSEMIRNNQHIQDYITQYPMASKVSNDDYPELDDLSHAVKPLVRDPFKSAWEGIKEGWGDQDLGPEEGEFKRALELFGPEGTMAVVGAKGALDLFGRAFNAALHGATRAGGTVIADLLKLDPADEQRMTREIGSLLEWSVNRGDLGTIAPKIEARDVLTAVKLAKPYLDAGEVPPPGITPWLDQIKIMQADEGLKALDDATKAAQKSKTVERSPDAGEEFLKISLGNRTIGVSAEAVMKLYGEGKWFTPDDGMLGWVPDIEKQMSTALATGGDVQVPLAGWLAKMDPAIAKELREDVRLSPEGVTKREGEVMKEPPSEEALPPREPANITELAQREAWFEHRIADRGIRIEPMREERMSEVDQDTRSILGEEPDSRGFHIYDGKDQIGSVHLRQSPTDPKTVIIEDIYSTAREGRGGANTIGMHAVRGMLDEIKREYPEATKVVGFRVSGAREKASFDQGQQRTGTASVNLSDPKALAQYLYDKGWTQVGGEPKLPGTITEQVSPKVQAEYRPTSLYSEREKDVHDAIGTVLNRMAPGVDWRTVDTLEGKGAGGSSGKATLGGVYFPPDGQWRSLILVAMRHGEFRDTAAVGSAFHEVIHHLRSGFFREKEWETLEKAAIDGKWAEKFGISQRYADAPEWLRTEEAVAEQFRTWANDRFLSGKLPSEITSVFERIKEFLDAVKEKLTSVFGKSVTYEQLFEDVAGGKIGRRQEAAAGKDRFGGFAQAFDDATKAEELKMFANGKAAGMTEEGFKRYMKLIDERRAEMEQKAQERAQRAVAATKTEQWKENEPRVKEETRARINQKPDIAADDFFRRGLMNDEKVARVRLGERYLTPEQKKALGPGMYAKGGIDPDSVAGTFGYFTGQEMVDAMAALHATRTKLGMSPQAFKNKLVREQTEARMQKQYGVPEYDNALREAREDVVTETQMDLLAEETMALATKTGQTPTFRKDQLKVAVWQSFVASPMAQAKNFEGFLREAGKAGRAAEMALLNGDFTEAFRQKQRQYIATLYSNESKRLGKEIKQYDRLTKTYAERQVKSTSQEYTDQIHRIMLQVGEQVKRSVQDLQESLQGTTLERFIDDKQRDLREIEVADFLMDGMFRKRQDQMSVEEFRGVNGSLKNLAFNGRNELQVEKEGVKRDFEDLRDQMIEQLETLGEARKIPLETKGKGILGTPKGGVKSLVRNYVASHLQMENILNRWDRFDPQGLFNQWVMRPLIESSNHLAALERKYSDRLGDLRDDKVNLNEKVANPILRDPLTGELHDMTRRNFRAMLTHFGNQSNFDKLAKGYGADPQVLWQWAMKTATKEDWNFVQGLGNIFADIKVEADRMYRRISGLAPESINIQPIQTPHGVYQGWYVPLVYDHIRGVMSRKAMGDALRGDEYFAATTPAGYTKSRTGFTGPLSLDLDFFGPRMKQMLNDIAMREAVIQASKFFRDPDLQQAIKKHSALGIEVEKGLMPYLKDVANMSNIDSYAAQGAAKWSEWFRQNTIMTLVGLNPGTVMKHFSTAMVQSAQEAGIGAFAQQMKNILTDLPSGQRSWRYAMDTSEELQRRHRHWNETLGGAYQEAFQESTLRQIIHRFGSYPVAFSDLVSAVPTWLAVYTKEMNDHGVQGDAVYAADRSVRRAHGSTATTNRPAIMRGGEMAQWATGLFGFFNHIMNRQVELVWRAKDMVEGVGDAKNLGEAAKIAVGDISKVLVPGLLAYYVLPALIEEMVSPLPQHKKEGWSTWAGKAMIKNMSASWIGIRDVVAGLVTENDPTIGLIGTGAKGMFNLYRDFQSMATSNKDKSGKVMKDLAVVLGTLYGVTPAQVGKTGQFLYETSKGQQRPKNAFEILRGLRYGAAKAPQPKR